MACTVYTRAFQRRFYCRAKNRNIRDKKAPSLRCVKRNVKRIQHKTVCLIIQCSTYSAMCTLFCVQKNHLRCSLESLVNPQLIFRLRLYL